MVETAYMGKVKEKTKRVFSLQELISQQILHSMGQYIQDGLRNIFETVIKVEKPRRNIVIEEDKDNLDGLKFISR